MGRLAGRKILITGAASGVGRAIATTFLREGASLCVLDRDEAGLQTFEKDSYRLVADLLDSARLPACVSQAASHLGGLDGVVNAAGIHIMARLEDTTDDLWSNTMAINLTAPMVIIRAALGWLRQSPAATIVNIASGSALYPVAERSAYIASKGGLVSLTKALAHELAPGIRVNCICPGAVDTPMLRGNLSDDAYARIAGGYALQRVAAPAEIADAALFLSGPESSYVTGTALAVDGGRTFH